MGAEGVSLWIRHLRKDNATAEKPDRLILAENQSANSLRYYGNTGPVEVLPRARTQLNEISLQGRLQIKFHAVSICFRSGRSAYACRMFNVQYQNKTEAV